MPEHSTTSGPLRLALAITELEVGGAERALTSLALGLPRDRFEPVVYSLAGRPQGEQAALVDQLETAGIPVHFLGLTSRWQFPTAVRRLRQLLKEQQPHVLQTFLIHANIVGALAGRRAGVKAICAGIRVAEPSRCRLWAERRALRRVDRIVCVSQAVAEYSRLQGKLPADKLLVIPNGIDLACVDVGEPVDLQSLGLPPSREAIVFVGRLDQQKGVDWLLDLSPGLLERLPGHDLLLVGDGPQRTTLQRQADQLGIADRVHFTGWRADAAGIMHSCRLLVLPSRWEGMPNVLLEAMARRLPVVATRVGGVEEQLGPLAEQQSVTLGDAGGFIERVVAIAQDNELASNLGRQNHQRVADHFSQQAMVSSYQRLYEERLER